MTEKGLYWLLNQNVVPMVATNEMTEKGLYWLLNQNVVPMVATNEMTEKGLYWLLDQNVVPMVATSFGSLEKQNFTLNMLLDFFLILKFPRGISEFGRKIFSENFFKNPNSKLSASKRVLRQNANQDMATFVHFLEFLEDKIVNLGPIDF